MRTSIRFAMCVAFAIIPVAAAQADITQIAAQTGKPFKHKPSGIVVAATAAGLARDSVAEFDDKQLDVIVDFRSPDEREVTTLYLFRNVTGNVPVWFDRIQRTMEESSHVGSLKLALGPAAFTPTGQDSARALEAAYTSSGSAWKSSAGAITSAGGWYVAVRASSQTLTPDQLLQRVGQTFAAVQWPQEKVPEPAVVPIVDCPNSLPQGEDAQPVAGTKADTLAGALLLAGLDLAVADKSTRKAPAEHPLWCRDPLKFPGAGVYRPNAATDEYLLALQDAGRGVWVSRAALADIVSHSAQPSYMVEFIDVDRHRGYGTFSSIPPAAQALWLLEHGSVVYSTSTWGDKKNIELNSDAVK